MKKKPFCLMPFIHFHAGNKGKVQACCVANIPYGNINEQSLEEIWQGKAIKLLRAKFLKGEIDNRCRVCLNQEVAGADSIRLETFKKYDFQKIEEPFTLPQYFDIRFSNVCNFRCRTCWHGASSRWFQEAQLLGTNIGQQAILKNIADFENFINKMGDALLQAKEIYLAGGEPLVTEEHYLLLDFLIAQGNTEVLLRYNTNFSKLHFKDKKILEYWKKFKNLEVWASLDGAGSLGAYIRKEMNWNTIVSNRKALTSLPHVQFKIAPTVSVLNVENLPDFYQYCLKNKLIQPADWYINILERPVHYNIQILPQIYKDRIYKKYNRFLQRDLPVKVRNAFLDILKYMKQKDASLHWQSFWQATDQLDNLRQESFEEITHHLYSRL